MAAFGLFLLVMLHSNGVGVFFVTHSLDFFLERMPNASNWAIWTNLRKVESVKNAYVTKHAICFVQKGTEILLKKPLLIKILGNKKTENSIFYLPAPD